MLGSPEPFLWNPIQSSLFRAWCCSSQARSFEGDAKENGFHGPFILTVNVPPDDTKIPAKQSIAMEYNAFPGFLERPTA